MKSPALILLTIALSAATAVLSVSFFQKNKKTAWVDLPKVFNEFEFKKELEKNYIKSEEARKKITDSLELELQIMLKSFEGKKETEITNEKKSEFQIKRENYLRKKEQFQQDDAQMKSEFNGQIYKQLTQYVKDYGKEKDLAVVLGAEGSGVILYGDENNEVTTEVIDFINNKYKGKTK